MQCGNLKCRALKLTAFYWLLLVIHDQPVDERQELKCCEMCCQVETGSESSTPRTPDPRDSRSAPFGGARDGGGHSGVEGLSDWRLRIALSSKQEFQVGNYLDS